MVLGCLRGDWTKDLTDYLCKARRFPLRPLRRKLTSASNNLFSELNTQILKPPLRERVRRACIYGETCSTINARVTARQEGSQRTVRKLGQRIRVGISTNWKRRAEEVGRTIDSLLAFYPPLVRDSWVRIWGWYRDADDRPPPPAHISLETLTEEFAEPYAHVLPPGRPIPIELAPFPVDDTIPREEEIAEVVLHLQLHRDEGPSGMRAEHLSIWLSAVTRE